MKKILYSLFNSSDIFRKLFKSYLLSRNILLVNFFDKKRQDIFNFIKNPELPINVTISQYEAYIVCMATQAIGKLDGDIAEIGVYQGGSARLICKYKGNKAFHLFDTFEGLPELNKFDTSNEFHKGQFNDTSFELIGKLLSDYPNVNIHKGYFPDTAGPVLDKKFTLVNLDVDLHKTTHDALEFFYPRMVKGGIILSHDYVNADGVRKAFDDFFADKPEPVLVVSDTQCLVVKS
jgi:O-methyltransferase